MKKLVKAHFALKQIIGKITFKITKKIYIIKIMSKIFKNKTNSRTQDWAYRVFEGNGSP